MKWAFSSLFLGKNCFLVWNHSLSIEISTVMEAWLDVNLHSGWIQWLLYSIEFRHKNTRSNTKFESWALLEYLVGKNSVGLESSTWKELVISKKSVSIRRMIWVAWIPKTIPNIRVFSHDKDVININFSILEILQSWLRQIRIYINKKVNGTVIEKRNAWNVFMVKNVISKRKMHIGKTNIDVRDNTREIVSLQRIPRKYGLVQMIWNSY